MRKLLPILLAILGLAVGVGAGYVLRPPAENAAPDAAPCTGAECPPSQESTAHPSEKDTGSGHGAGSEGDKEKPEGAPEYVKLNNQFIVPDMRDGKVADGAVVGRYEGSGHVLGVQYAIGF